MVVLTPQQEADMIAYDTAIAAAEVEIATLELFLYGTEAVFDENGDVVTSEVVGLDDEAKWVHRYVHHQNARTDLYNDQVDPETGTSPKQDAIADRQRAMAFFSDNNVNDLYLIDVFHQHLVIRSDAQKIVADQVLKPHLDSLKAQYQIVRDKRTNKDKLLKSVYGDF